MGISNTSLECKICASPRLSLLYRLKGHDIFRCKRCGFGQIFISDQALATFYDEDYFLGGKAQFAQERNIDIDAAHRFWLEAQLQNFKNRNRIDVLEVGPGLGGSFAREFRKHWPQVTYEAIEASPFAAEHLRESDFTIHLGRPSDPKILQACSGRFDLIIGTEVIEHDPDPHAFTHAIRNMLKPGGLCAFTTGNLAGAMARIKRERWYYLDPPAHVSYFTPSSAKHLFKSEGMCDVSVRKIGFNYIKLQLERRIPGILFLANLLSLPTGMTIVARRTDN